MILFGFDWHKKLPRGGTSARRAVGLRGFLESVQQSGQGS
jgi:hypothetical protein